MNFKYIEVNIRQPDTLSLFHKFYNELLKYSFNENQLETQTQLLETLKKNETGFWGKNSYHIIIILNNDNAIIGGIIYDYFFNTNSGLIEYIVTNKNYKKHGVATYAFNIACQLLNREASSHGFKRINFICSEVQKINSSKEAKHYFWEKFRIQKIKL